MAVSSLYGLNAGIIDQRQFTILIGAVIGSAVIPTIIAQRWFAPPVHVLTSEEIIDVEDEEFEPSGRGFLVGGKSKGPLVHRSQNA